MSAANVCVFVPEDRFQNKRDPMSHRIIEKRRRDRMNNCLADLSRLIPAIYLKKVGRGRVEKTEIIEMAIKHLKHLQTHACNDPATCEVAQRIDTDHRNQYRLGFQECMSECVRFLVDIEGMYANDELCIRLMSHLQKHLDKLQGHGFCYQAAGSVSSAPVPPAPPMVGRTSTIGNLSLGNAASSSSSSSSSGGSGGGSCSNSTTIVPQVLQQPQQQQPQNPQLASSIPIQIHPPTSGLGTNVPSPAMIQIPSEDVKPLDNEPSESAFTRRAGGTFAPRGGLLQAPLETAQIHHLMVPKQETRASTERKVALSDSARSPLGGIERSASQLREMLQTPTSFEPNMRKRSNTDTNLSIASVSSCGDVSPSKTPNLSTNLNEEVYHFKKNIKERFQSDLRVFTLSPTESADGDELKDLNGHEERRYSHSQVQGPVASPHSPASFSRHTVSAPPIGETDPETAVCAKDLTVNTDGRQAQVKWEPSQIDSNSSSTASPPSVNSLPGTANVPTLPSLPRSSGSTSGYSSASTETINTQVLLQPVTQASPPPQAGGLTSGLTSGLAGGLAGGLPSAVPIFASHPNGSYYIPLSMDISLLTPHLQAIDNTGPPLLHPVSISVNFHMSTICNKHVSAPLPRMSPWIYARANESRLPIALPNGTD